MNDTDVRQHSPKRYIDSNLGKVLDGLSHLHCHFEDVSAKGATFERFDFSYCVFVRAYFNNATLSGCKFVGAHFIDCNFRNASLRDCDFSYATINGTRLPTNEILNNLPPWPNVRRELLQILRRNAASVGDYQSEKVFVIHEIEAEKEHYRRAWKRDEQYYQKKYGPRFRWLGAGAKLLVLKLDNFVWGHGERIWKAPIALALLLIIFSIILAVVRIPRVLDATLSEALEYFAKAFQYHMNLLLDLPNQSGLVGLVALDWAVVIVRVIAIGVLVAALYRRLSHR